MGHPDFRVGGKIFATLGYPDSTTAMVNLTPEQQDSYMRAYPDAFRPCAGVWGCRGATHVALKAAKTATVREALEAAWRKTAPKRLVS